MRQLLIGSLAAATLAFVLGCNNKGEHTHHHNKPVSDDTSETKPDKKEKPAPEVEQKKPAPTLEAHVEAVWESKLRYQPDMPSPSCAVAGRVRLYDGDKATAREGDGVITIELYDLTPQPGIKEPILLATWRIEGDSMKHFLVENAANPEYQFVLPWDTYRKDIAQVRLDVKYEPKAGKELSAKSDIITFDRSDLKEAAQ